MAINVQPIMAWIGGIFGQLGNWAQLPILLMVIVQLAGAGTQVWSKEVIRDYDINPFILVFMRQAVASVILSPMTYLERNTRPAMTRWIFFKIVCCSLLGIVSNQCFFIAGLKYTSSTKASAIANLFPVLTWIMGLISGQENFNQFTTVHGLCKCFGTLVCVSGAVIIATFKGPIILFNSGLFPHWFTHGTDAEESALGILFVIASCLSAAAWYTILANLRQTYNAPITTTCLASCLSVVPLAVVAVSFEHDIGVWRSMGAMDYGLAVYSGVIGTALSVYLINLCINLRNSQFVSSFSPLSLVIVTILGWIFTNDIIYLGSLIGSIVLLIGLGVALWGMNGQMGS